MICGRESKTDTTRKENTHVQIVCQSVIHDAKEKQGVAYYMQGDA